MLDMVPSFRRQIRTYIVDGDTDSDLAAYLADGVEGLANKWNRTYVITTPAPNTYIVTPDIAITDKRAVLLMSSIIYKIGSVSLASFRDGDFAYDPVHLRVTPYLQDAAELEKLLPAGRRLASGSTSPLRGYSNIWNKESYQYIYDLIFPI